MAIETFPVQDGNGTVKQVAADQVGSSWYPVEKAAFGADGVEPTLVSASNPLPVAPRRGTFGYAAGVTTGTVTPPAGAKLERVNVIADGTAGATGASVTIGGGDPISIEAGGYMDETIPGDTPSPAVVIGGQIKSYYIAWTV